jgi:hypothetical protein
MTEIEIEGSSTQRTQRVYAKLAGFLFLWLIITGLGGMFLTSHIVSSGTFAEMASVRLSSVLARFFSFTCF